MGLENEKSENWFDLYQKAILELERIKITGRIGDARAGISARVEELRQLPGLHNEELHSLNDALSMLRSLEQQEARLHAEDMKRIAEEALDRIKRIAPKVEESNAQMED